MKFGTLMRKQREAQRLSRQERTEAPGVYESTYRNRYSRSIGLWLVGLLLGTGLALAQTPTVTLTGRVLDAKTGQLLPFASVYLNNSTRGTTADEAGTYRLTGVPLGTHELVGSLLGHATARQTLRLGEARAYAIDLKLEASANDLTAVTVRGRRSGAWQRQFRQLSRELLGSRPPARQTRITNPDVLRFDEEKGHLRARASEPLVIENDALGYRLHYTLLHVDLYRGRMDFAGDCRFEEMKPTSARQQAAWQANRLKAYRGSLHHLLASMLSGTHESEGFTLYQSPLVVDSKATDGQAMPLVRTSERRWIGGLQAAALFRPGAVPFERRLVSAQPLEVYYNRVYAGNSPYGDSPSAYSMLLLPNQSFDLTTDGWVTQGKGLDVRGYLGQDRLATLLPADWVPADWQTLTATDIAAGRTLRSDARLDWLNSDRQRQAKQTAPLVFVHTDKALYSTGDQLYLSAYVLDPARQLPLAGRSADALQVDLVSPTGRLVGHQWLRLTDGRAVGSLRLSDTLVAGTYRLRAYTDRDGASNGPGFECPLTVYNSRLLARSAPVGSEIATRLGTAPARPPVADSLDVQFLPEGGRWLVGVAGRLGIKVVRPGGRGRAVSGRIVDESGGEVTRFTTNRLGLGHVNLTPTAGRYWARLDAVAGVTTQPVPLPAAEPEGWALAVDAVTDSSRLRVTARATGRYQQQPVYVTLQSREQLVYRQKWQLTKGEVQFGLPITTLPPGVCRLTVWDTTGQARAERLVFVAERSGSVQMRVTTGKPRYAPREPVAIGLQFRDPEHYPVAAIWSAAVTDADQLPADTIQPDLRTYLLLTGGLRGPIESPGYYLAPEHKADLDNLLLTQGWRRLPAAGPTDTTGGWQLSGRANDRQGKPLAGRAVVTLLEGGNERLLRSDSTDAEGRFVVGGLLLADTVRVRARVLGRGTEGAVIRFEGPGVAFATSSVPEPDWSALSAWVAGAQSRQADWPGLYRDSTARQLAEVVVRAPKLRNERPKEVERASLHIEADAKLIIDETNPSFMNITKMVQLLQRLPGVQILGGKIVVRKTTSSNNDGPLFLVDGAYVDQNIALDLEPRMVSRIELVANAGAAIYGARGANGVIAIYTRKGKIEDLAVASNSASVITAYGFVTPREYYVPRYELAEVAAHTDRRDVLYWQPLGRSDADGLARLVFPLSDTAKQLRVVVQGLTTEGVPIYYTWVLPVR